MCVCCRYSNPAASRLTGYPKEEIRGRNCRFLRRDNRGTNFVDGKGAEPSRTPRTALPPSVHSAHTVRRH